MPFPEEVMTAVEEWVNGKDPDFFSSGLMAWLLNTVGLSASHWRAITSKKKRWISTGNKLGLLLIDLPSYILPLRFCIVILIEIRQNQVKTRRRYNICPTFSKRHGRLENVG